MTKKVIGFVNMFNEPSLGPLTENRTIGSTSFLGRYAVMDFALSNFTNSGIDSINVIVKEYFRSVAKHCDSLKPWVTNTKIGTQNILINEKGIRNPELNTDLACIAHNDWTILEAKADVIVIAPSYVISTVDFREAIKEHDASGAKVSVVYTKCHEADTKFKNGYVLKIDEDGFVKDAYPNDGTRKHLDISLSTFIIDYDLLDEIMDKYVRKVETPSSLRDALADLLSSGEKISAIEYKGYSAMFDSLRSFMENSFELLDLSNAKRLFDDIDWPIYTISHDTIPTLYGVDSEVKNSYIANGAIIEGTVLNSIISRNVKVSKGAVIKNSIILTSTFVGENAIIENALIDKYAHINANKEIKGTKAKPVFIEQGKKLR